MKRIFLATLFCALTGFANAQTTNRYTFNPNTLILDGSPAGMTQTFDVSGLTGPIQDVQVELNIAGGFNGSLYAYLINPSGNQVVLLNRVGVGSGNLFGYGNTGFNITLDDTGANIHNYQEGGFTLNGDGQLMGTWAPDGRNIDPLSSGGTFDASLPISDLSLFDGTDPNGTWTLFISDLVSGGSDARLVSWSVNLVTPVPEPQAWMLGLAGAVVFIGFRGRKS